MSTITLRQPRLHDRAPVKDGFDPPQYALRDMPQPSDLPKDEIGKEIAILLAEHPAIAPRFNTVGLNALPMEARLEMLTSIKSELGIKPIRRRHLGYVGPDVPMKTLKLQVPR